MIIVDEIQGSDEWLKLKIGKPSASNASKIVTNAGLASKQQEGYMFELAGEVITGKKEQGYKNSNMEEGNNREDESRKLLQQVYKSDADVMVNIDKKELCINLHRMSYWKDDKVVQKLCDELNQTKTKFPGTDLIISYKLVSL